MYKFCCQSVFLAKGVQHQDQCIANMAIFSGMLSLLTDPVQPGLFYKQLSNSFIQSGAFSFRSSKHHNSQTIRARELIFFTEWSRVMYHVSCVTCNLSHVNCQVSPVTYKKNCIKKKSCTKNWTKCWSQSVDGLLSTGPNPSS